MLSRLSKHGIRRIAYTVPRTPLNFQKEVVGEVKTFDYSVYIKKDQKRISFWHDIALNKTIFDQIDKVQPFVCEIPRGELAKYEINKKETSNPIKQDIKHEKLRYYPFAGNTHYGAMPQTFESDQTHYKNYKGDRDPLDILDFSKTEAKVGDVYNVKILGALPFVDDNEMDWKILAYRESEAEEKGIRDLQDFITAEPNAIPEVITWFKTYKMADKKTQKFLNDEKPIDLGQTLALLEQFHGCWKLLEFENPEGYWLNIN